jgi:hypothetical protein
MVSETALWSHVNIFLDFWLVEESLTVCLELGVLLEESWPDVATVVSWVAVNIREIFADYEVCKGDLASNKPASTFKLGLDCLSSNWEVVIGILLVLFGWIQACFTVN